MKTITELLAAYTSGDTTPTEVMTKYLAEIKSKDADINAFLHVYEEEALSQAAEATAAYATGEVTDKPLLGIPLAIKNNILIKDHLATAASKMLENYIAIYDATIIERLRDAGAPLVQPKILMT